MEADSLGDSNSIGVPSFAKYVRQAQEKHCRKVVFRKRTADSFSGKVIYGHEVPRKVA